MEFQSARFYGNLQSITGQTHEKSFISVIYNINGSVCKLLKSYHTVSGKLLAIGKVANRSSVWLPFLFGVSVLSFIAPAAPAFGPF